MAYDPQNPLDAITGERAKRGKKNPNARTVQNQDEATGVGPGTQRIQPRQSGGRFNIPTGRTTPWTHHLAPVPPRSPAARNCPERPTRVSDMVPFRSSLR